MSSVLDDQAMRRAIEERVARDFGSLTPAAKQRYRAALRAGLRRAQAERSEGSEAISAFGGEVGFGALAALGVGLVAMTIGPMAGMVLGGTALTAFAAARKGEEDADAVLAGANAALDIERALELHLAAMAQSRRAYYLAENPGGRQTARRSV
jgi:hypothetical protein